ncbi:MAG: DUF932 domain-containing protein [Clostridiales bacterium]|nr:DUF932 domain-containing protein [Clostridiales bacterium]
MIIEKGFESLKELGTENVGLDGLIDKAEDMETRWRDDFVTGHRIVPVDLTRNLTAVYTPDSMDTVEADLTDTAFSQLCQRAGVPGSYIKKCYETGREDLAVENFFSFTHTPSRDASTMRLRVFDGTVRAALSMQYNPFDHPEILYGVKKAVGKDGRYEANEAFLSPDRMHIRFVDFNNPLKVHGDRLYSGFTVSSSNVGTAAFSIKYFLYRFACKNGIVRVQHGGILFRQTHLQEFLQDGEELFAAAIEKMHAIDQITEKQIDTAMNRRLTAQELSFYLDKAQTELHLGKKGREKAADLIGTDYDPTMWGFINSITDTAHDYTLDTRLSMEQWAGNMLAAA